MAKKLKNLGLRDEIDKTLSWFAEMDRQQHGKITKSTRKAMFVQTKNR